MLDNWHRLERVIKWTGLSVNSFALNLGLKRSENLYQIKKGNNGISRDLADMITAKYPSISKGWLLTGEGDMFMETKTEPVVNNGVPFYGMDAVVAAQEQDLPEPRFFINMPTFSDSDIAALSLGTAMHPEIPAGAMVILKKWPVAAIIPGESYLIISPRFKGIRIIRRTENPMEYLLLPRNTNEYDPIVLDKNKITKLLIVRGIIIKKIL